MHCLSALLFKGSNTLDFKVISKVTINKSVHAHNLELLHFVDKEIHEYRVCCILHLYIYQDCLHKLLSHSHYRNRRYSPPIFSEHTAENVLPKLFWVILSKAYTHSTGYKNEYRFKILQSHLFKNLIALSFLNIWGNILAYVIIFHVLG